MGMISDCKIVLIFEIRRWNYYAAFAITMQLWYQLLFTLNSHFGGLWGQSDLHIASVAFEVKCDLRFDASNLNHHGINVHITRNSHYGGLWGHSDLHMTSKVTSDLKFELSVLNNPCSSAYLASDCLFSLNFVGRRRKAIYDPLTRSAWRHSLVKIGLCMNMNASCTTVIAPLRNFPTSAALTSS